MHKLKPLRDVEVRDSKDNLSRVSSADSNSNSRATPVSIKEKIANKRYFSSNDQQQKPPTPIESSTPDLLSKADQRA